MDGPHPKRIPGNLVLANDDWRTFENVVTQAAERSIWKRTAMLYRMDYISSSYSEEAMTSRNGGFDEVNKDKVHSHKGVAASVLMICLQFSLRSRL